MKDKTNELTWQRESKARIRKIMEKGFLSVFRPAKSKVAKGD